MYVYTKSVTKWEPTSSSLSSPESLFPDTPHLGTMMGTEEEYWRGFFWNRPLFMGVVLDLRLVSGRSKYRVRNRLLVNGDFFEFLFKIHKKTNFCLFQSEFSFVFWILEKPHFLWEMVLNFKIIHICLCNIRAKYYLTCIQSSTKDISWLTLVYCKAVNDTKNSTLRLIFMLCFCYLLPPPLPPKSRTARHG